jgi:nucleoside-triphosphatase
MTGVNRLKKRVLLLTGDPGVGKTTVLIKTADGLKAGGICLGGMISREVREGNVRVGFEIIDLTSGKLGWLARVNQQIGSRVGKYHVNLQDLEIIGAKAIRDATEKCDVIAIDEIGPMELYSPKFKKAVAEALESKKLVLAVVHAKAKDSLITEAKEREDAEVFTVTLSNRDSLPQSLTNQVFTTFNR